MGATMHCSVRTYKVQFNSHASRGYICITGCGYSVRNYRISDSSASLKKLCLMHWVYAVMLQRYQRRVSSTDWIHSSSSSGPEWPRPGSSRDACSMSVTSRPGSVPAAFTAASHLTDHAGRTQRRLGSCSNQTRQRFHIRVWRPIHNEMSGWLIGRRRMVTRG